MNVPSALVILVLLLFGPLVVEWIERNIEIYFLLLGITATFLAGGFKPHIVESALTEPVAISLAVIIAGLIFGYTRERLDHLFARLRRKVSRPVLAGTAIFIVASVASLITVIVAALILVEMIGLLHLTGRARERVTIAGCYALGLGASLTPLGEPLSTLAASALHLGFFGLFDLLALYVVPGMFAASLLAAIFARGSYQEAPSGPRVRESFMAAVLQGVKIFAFVGGLVLISHAFAPLASYYVNKLSNEALFWANTVSAALDNATLVALEVHNMSLPRAREAIIALLVSGGMLIPGNIPNIICAGALRIGSVTWARVGIPIGLVMLGIYFAALQFLG